MRTDVTPMLAERTDLAIPVPYLVFIGDIQNPTDAKTGYGLVEWRRDWCAAQWRLPGCPVDLGLPELAPTAAHAAGARTLVIGVAPAGGRIPEHWMPALLEALRAGLNLAAGLHDRLANYPELVTAARASGVRLFDARQAPPGLVLPVGSGARRSGRRVLTVGTDCAIGKKYTALALERELRGRGVAADFRATGQTGVLISGGGLAIDAVVSDFVAGTVEMLSPAADLAHWDVIEGQGSLFHPAYAGVSLGLLHGAQADAIVLCHDTRRHCIDGYDNFPMPSVEECIALNLRLGALTQPAIQCVGISLNTQGMSAAQRQQACAELAERTGLPVTDPIAMGVQPIVDRLLQRCN
ncbi:DUF1611 domain-containing protein [Roseateles sp.]|uniref:DUF1611 domain-containing protein n=1 Tax=Roseateles sp. TaxID=1971397 RepID=UPI0037CA989C